MIRTICSRCGVETSMFTVYVTYNGDASSIFSYLLEHMERKNKWIICFECEPIISAALEGKDDNG